MRLQPTATGPLSVKPAGRLAGLMMALRRANSEGPTPCPGCPIYPHIRDRELRFPTCELCHWPAVDVGSVHVWRCTSCRHLNEHGNLRPRVAVVLLDLRTISAAARLLEVADPVYGYFAPRPHSKPNRARIRRRSDRSAPRPASPSLRIVRRRVWRSDGVAQPVYARATVAGMPVLIVGGDRLHPHPLGGNDREPNGCSLGNRATRIACPCDQPAPCLHGQALYAHVLSCQAPGPPERLELPEHAEPPVRATTAG